MPDPALYRRGVSRRLSSWPVWTVLAVALAVALFAGSHHGGGAPTVGQRVASIASDIRCPSCSGLSAEDSNASTAVAIRSDIRARVIAGQSDAQIETYLTSRYGPGILLRPPVSGLSALVWILPAAAAVAAVGVLVGVFWRRERGLVRRASASDHELVQRELEQARAGDR
jgi:cytochrome c-type biogenesis protein CcmH